MILGMTGMGIMASIRLEETEATPRIFRKSKHSVLQVHDLKVKVRDT